MRREAGRALRARRPRPRPSSCLPRSSADRPRARSARRRARRAACSARAIASQPLDHGVLVSSHQLSALGTASVNGAMLRVEQSRRRAAPSCSCRASCRRWSSADSSWCTRSSCPVRAPAACRRRPSPRTSCTSPSASVMIQCRLSSCAVSSPTFEMRDGVGEVELALARRAAVGQIQALRPGRGSRRSSCRSCGCRWPARWRRLAMAICRRWVDRSRCNYLTAVAVHGRQSTASRSDPGDGHALRTDRRTVGPSTVDRRPVSVQMAALRIAHFDGSRREVLAPPRRSPGARCRRGS